MKHIKKLRELFQSKQAAEIDFWCREIERYEEWFSGELPMLYQTPSPNDDQKVSAPNRKDASILTWHKLHQEVKYLADLDLTPDVFVDQKLLDVGSGPIPSATCFHGAKLYCLEPLLAQYIAAGFPLHYYGPVRFVHGKSESIPLPDSFFDAVISVNAIDHVDNLSRTASEIRRVLRPGGKLRMHVHYHPPTKCEPLVIDDELFLCLFSWCGALKKLKISHSNHSTALPEDQSFVLWSNF